MFQSIIMFLMVLVLSMLLNQQYAQLDSCQANCESKTDRLAGPTRPPNTLPHPWSVAPFPISFSGFCKLGCQFFYTETPQNTTCINICAWFYRYRVTDGYSDVAEEAKLECQNGCSIGLQICQAGYYCSMGIMLPCPPGTYREPVTNLSTSALKQAESCTNCPYGRYRSANKGKSANECSKCPIGKYVNATGSTSESNCQRCPAGKNAEQEGMRYCKCITSESCDLEIGSETYYKNGVDYDRETIPFIGRW